MDPFGTKGQEAKPKPKPPARLAAKKPVMAEEEKKSDDVEMADDQPAFVSNKPALTKKAPPTAKSSTTAAKTTAAPSTKGPAGPKIDEEEAGAGLSKEEAEAKV